MPVGDDHAREAFSLLAHEIRLDILLALLDHWHADRTEPQGYSELMHAVGIEDSGKFNYHLDKLRGTYLRKVEGGYVPLASATALYRAVLGNQPTASVDRTDFALETPCPECETGLMASYEKEFLSVTCQSCESRVAQFTYPLPKNGLTNRDAQEIVRTVHRRARYHVGLARTGQCPFCAGCTAIDIRIDDPDTEFEVEMTCDTCTFLIQVDLLFSLLLDSRVAGALLELGVPVESAYKWELPTPATRVESRDPLRIVLDIQVDDRTASIVVDGGLAVHGVTVDGNPVGPDEARDSI